MPFPASSLSKPLVWINAAGDKEIRAVLSDLQGNILKPHGRDHVLASFLRFDVASAIEARAAARLLGDMATPAYVQLQQAKRFREDGVPADTFVSVALSSAGYAALEIAAEQIPASEPFAAGFADRAPQLGVADDHSWDPHFLTGVHALVLLADDDLPRLQDRHRTLLEQIQAGARELASDRGTVYRDQRLNAVEHFGFADGRSQPLLLVEDVQREQDEGGGVSRWNPAFPLEIALVKCPGGKTALSFGSFLVFWKLEQNVRGFQEDVQRLAANLGVSAELAEAMVVGRFRDGTPLAMRGKAEAFNPIWNNFDYADDGAGNRCPFQAHVRRMNPRRTSAQVEGERSRVILRRAVPYGVREQDPVTKGFTDQPTGGVGLLFMSYQASFSWQFEFLLNSWGKGAGFPAGQGESDPLVGPAPGADPAWPTAWGKPGRQQSPFGRHVVSKGGEYFFTPSLSCLRGLPP